MKFTDGFWQVRPGVTALYAQEAYDIEAGDGTPDGAGIVITAPTAVIADRGDALNRAVLTTTLSSPAEGVVRVRIAHHDGGAQASTGSPCPAPGGGSASVADLGCRRRRSSAGALAARIAAAARPWDSVVRGRRPAGDRPASHTRPGLHPRLSRGRGGRPRASSSSRQYDAGSAGGLRLHARAARPRVSAS